MLGTLVVTVSTVARLVRLATASVALRLIVILVCVGML